MAYPALYRNDGDESLMARIRSIKPEFFISETLASVSISARLTFIGMWTYVDDNGVGIDNEKLIAAALYALDPDPLETLRRVSDDLRQLSAVGVITRYESGGRRYVFVTNWVEHQKVTHPGKPRFPRPSQIDPRPPTSGNGISHESLTKLSGESHEDLTRVSVLSREQGAGSREQGAGMSPPATVTRIHAHRGTPEAEAPSPSAPRKRKPRPPVAERFDDFWKVYPKREGKPSAERAWTKAVEAGADPQEIIDGAVEYFMRRKGEDPKYTKGAAAWLNDRRWEDEPPAPYTPSAAPGASVVLHGSGRHVDDYGGDAHMARYLARAEARKAAGGGLFP